MKAYLVHGRICRHLQECLPGPTLTSQARWLLLINAGNDKPERHPLMLLSSEPLMMETGHFTAGRGGDVGKSPYEWRCLRTGLQNTAASAKFPEMRGCGRTRVPWPGVKMHSTALQCHTEQKVPLATQRVVDFSADLPSNKGYLCCASVDCVCVRVCVCTCGCTLSCSILSNSVTPYASVPYRRQWTQQEPNYRGDAEC